MKQSLRTRLMLAYAGLLLIGFVGLGLLAGQQISAGTEADYEDRLVEQVSLVAQGMAGPVEEYLEGEMRETSVVQLLTNYATQFDREINLVWPDGTIWLNNDGVVTSNENIATDPEVIAALNQEVVSDTRPDGDSGETVYAAAPIIYEGQTLAVVRISDATGKVQRIVAQRWGTLGIGVAFLALISLGVSLWLAASLIRPLTHLRTSAQRIAAGDFSQTIPTTRQDEIGVLATSFNHMAAQVQAMIEEQRTFAGNAAHELRTPLTTIRLRTEALRYETVDSNTAKQYIIEMDNEVKRLGNLIQDLMLLSRIDAGRLAPGQEQIDPIRLAQQLHREFLPTAKDEQIGLTLETPDTLPSVTAGLNHLQMVFRNLLSNALKYTPTGGNITWQLQQANNGLQATMMDTGQGIAADDLPHLFDRFYRADKARSRQISGTGLGLSLVRSIIQFYGGHIAIESAGLGQGTTVIVWWPLQPTSANGTHAQ